MIENITIFLVAEKSYSIHVIYIYMYIYICIYIYIYVYIYMSWFLSCPIDVHNHPTWYSSSYIFSNSALNFQWHPIFIAYLAAIGHFFLPLPKKMDTFYSLNGWWSIVCIHGSVSTVSTNIALLWLVSRKIFPWVLPEMSIVIPYSIHQVNGHFRYLNWS